MNNDDKLGRTVTAVLAGVVLVLVGVSVAVLLITGWAETGPGCPGDPEWLGYCHDTRKDG